jgi:hypothetical protein
MHVIRVSVATLVLVVAAGFGAAQASASHAWGNYHWARASNPFTVPLGDRVTADWDSRLARAAGDWSRSSVLDSPVVAGTGNGCKAANGRIQVCNDTYGFNGWLGLAQIWVRSSHIVRATTKMNDSYLSSPTYSDTNKQHVMCQEVGHGYGLGHQDESGADLNTCMDYSNALDNPSPNAHDYQQLETIYNSHVDSGGQASAAVPTGSGRVVHTRDGLHTSYTVRDLGNGFHLHEFISWAVPGA